MPQKAFIKAENLFWETRLGIHTRGPHTKEDRQGELHGYGTAPYRTLFAMLRRLDLQRSDIFADLGSGKGRVVCCAALYPIKQVIGVEYDENLCEVARQNAGRLRGAKTEVSIISGRVEEFDYYRANIYYLFNPFGLQTLTAVLAKMEASVATRTQPLRIVYSNPRHEEILAAAPWLERYMHMPSGGALEPQMSFWRSLTPAKA